jgi:hypothetical protein
MAARTMPSFATNASRWDASRLMRGHANRRAAYTPNTAAKASGKGSDLKLNPSVASPAYRIAVVSTPNIANGRYAPVRMPDSTPPARLVLAPPAMAP